MKITDYLPDASADTVRTAILLAGVFLGINYLAIPAIDRFRARRNSTRNLTSGI